MTHTSPSFSLRQAAVIGGLSYLAIFIFAALANSFALEQVIISGDAAATARNIIASPRLFRLGIAGWIVTLMADVLVAWALYYYFKPVHSGLSLLAALMRVIFVGIFATGLVNLFPMLELLSGSEYLEVFEPAELTAQIMPYLSVYEHAVHVSFVPFGLCILATGYLVLKSGTMPRGLGILLIVAAVGYQIDSFANFLSPAYAANQTYFIIFVAVPAAVAEGWLWIWLLWKGGKERALRSISHASRL